MTNEALKYLRNSEIDDYMKDALTDISQVTVDKTKPVKERLTEFINEVGNPYVFKVGDIAVKVCYNPNGKNISEAVADAFRNYTN